MSHNKEKNKKQLLYIVSILLILLVAVGVSLYKFTSNSTPTPTTEPTIVPTPQYSPLSQPTVDTSTWKAYTDPILKYAIKYPSTVIIDPRQYTVGQTTKFIFPDDQNYPADGGGDIARLGIYVIISKSKDPKEAIKENTVNGGSAFQEFPNIRINNAYGVDTSYGTGGTIDTETNLLYYVNDSKKSGKIIYLYLSGYPQNDPKKIETLKQILRTFHFVR